MLLSLSKVVIVVCNCKIVIFERFKIEFLRLKYLKVIYCYFNNCFIGENINNFKIYVGINNLKGVKLNYLLIFYINSI